MFQSPGRGDVSLWDLLVKDVPEGHKQDLDYIVDMLDWELNVEPNFYANRFLAPKPVKSLEEMREEGYEEYHIVDNSEYFGVKELTILPKQTVTMKDNAAYGAIVVQGHGKFGALDIESPVLIRFGQMTKDELFVTCEAANEGITITNESDTDPLVMLKHFGPEA